MSALFNAVIGALDHAGWQHRRVEGLEVVEAEFEAYHTKVCLHVQAFPELDAISVVAEAPLLETSGPRHIRAVAEVLVRANAELTLGSFEMKPETGRFHFRVSNVFPSAQFDPQIIASLVHTTVVEMDRITPFVAVTEKTPANQLSALDVGALLAREDLLPEVGDGSDAAGAV